MATFEEQVEALTGISIDGSSNPTQTELSQFLVDGVVDVVNRVIAARPEELSKFTTTTNSTTTVTKSGKVLSVAREHDSTSILRPCSPINPAIRYEATDADSLHYRSKYNPGFYELDGLIHVVPTPNDASNNDLVVTQVHYDLGLVYGDNYNNTTPAIAKFPTDYEYLVAIYAAIKSLQNKMASTSITALTVASVPPDAVAAPSFTYDNTIANTALNLATTTIAEANNFIDNDEDVELANAKLAEAQHSLNDAKARIDNELNEYKQEIDDYTQKLAKFQADIGSYTSEVAKEIQEFTNNLQRYGSEYKWWETQAATLQRQYDAAFAQSATASPAEGGK